MQGKLRKIRFAVNEGTVVMKHEGKYENGDDWMYIMPEVKSVLKEKVIIRRKARKYHLPSPTTECTTVR